ncbi:hypothetical protein BGW80DRAFT_1253478 [Lactifluus volemus]|nr:hypothetical protein BGW80DRAFT_1253478 [Lactifluus volemus]
MDLEESNKRAKGELSLRDTDTDKSSIADLPDPPPSPTAASIDQRDPTQIPNTITAEVPPNNTRQEPVKIRIPKPFSISIPITRPISTIPPPSCPYSVKPLPANLGQLPQQRQNVDPVLVTISEATQIIPDAQVNTQQVPILQPVEGNVMPNIHPTSSKRPIPMRANNSLSARNLFAIDYLKGHPNVTREDFSIVWDTLEPETVTRYKQMEQDAKKDKKGKKGKK